MTVITLVAMSFAQPISGAPFVIEAGRNLTLSYPSSSRPVLKTAVGILDKDLRNVFGSGIELTDSDAAVMIAVDSASVKEEQGFSMAVTDGGKLIITGHDSHGAAYGVIELSRLIGVSPWEWWADATPQKMERFELPERFSMERAPSVKYRGIFINDEDWGLMPWSGGNFEPSDIAGRIGPKTNARIFELMLRLRANTYWPAMHECTVPFFLTEGNRETAEKYGIYVGGSHCEPMACNAAGEWSRRGNGDYDYVNNSEAVYRFWEERVKEVAAQEIIYTIGMRGVHDGAMKGAKTIGERKETLSRVIQDQRRLLSEYVDRDVTKVPQVFIPYKEVLDIYDAGLEVPEDVTLMWCDDNYGYIRHFPTPEERARKGGNGIYYHVSYWGRPHDYLWLGTASPYLLYQQMKLAYDKGIREIWILNVGDIKPSEYQMELFMDMAWDISAVSDRGPAAHLRSFLAREFGSEMSGELLPVMNEHYRLAYIRKPEFMGNTRVEERDREYYKVVRDLPWGIDSLTRRDLEYQRLSDRVEELWLKIPAERQDCYYQLVKYPVQGAAQMNRKMIAAQKARHGLSTFSASDIAHDSIISLTETYNHGINNEGKWAGIMDCSPRRLPVFDRAAHRTDSVAMKNPERPVVKWNGTDAVGKYVRAEGLGHEGRAIALLKNEAVSFSVPPVADADSLMIDIRLVPTHPTEGKELVFSVLYDGIVIGDRIHYETVGRSEEWKENVLRNQAIRQIIIPNDSLTHQLAIRPETDGILLDRISLSRHSGNLQ